MVTKEKRSELSHASRAHAKLGWKPQVDFEQLIEMMVDADLKSEKLKPNPAEL